VSAKGVDKPAPESSAVVVVNSNGSSLFKLYYKSGKPQKVKISLIDEKGNSIYSEMLKTKKGFVRPYNLDGVNEGHYAIRVEDETGTVEKKIDYVSAKMESWVGLTKMAGEESKYALRVGLSKADDVTINIYDENSTLLHSETQHVDGGFAKLYNMKGVQSFTVEVVDSNGLIKSVKN
jgi:hypothetical protein